MLQIHLMSSPCTADTTEMHRMATLSVIDLASSQRASATKNMGKHMVKGTNINKSLLTLGNCINALCEAQGACAIPEQQTHSIARVLAWQELQDS